MTFRGQFRSFALALGTLLLASGALLATSGAAQADEFCPGGNVCFWKQALFQGDKAVFGNSPEGVWRSLGSPYHSIKNNFDNRAVWTALSGQSATCTNPGTNRSGAPVFNVFLVGAAGSRC